MFEIQKLYVILLFFNQSLASTLQKLLHLDRKLFDKREKEIIISKDRHFLIGQHK